jgi:hypothetical protein
MRRFVVAAIVALGTLLVCVAPAGAAPPIDVPVAGSSYRIWPSPEEGHVSYVRATGEVVINAWQTGYGYLVYGPEAFFAFCPNPAAGASSRAGIYHVGYAGYRVEDYYLYDSAGDYLGWVSVDTALTRRSAAVVNGTECVRWDLG